MKKAIYAFHNEYKYIHIKDIIRIVCQNYNNKRHTTTKFTPNEIFFSDDKAKFKEVINNIKKKFKYVNNINIIRAFNIGEKALLSPKYIKTKKYYNKDQLTFLQFKKIKNLNCMDIICVIISEYLKGDNYKIKIMKTYSKYQLKENEFYIVSSKLLKKCKNTVWDKLLSEI